MKSSDWRAPVYQKKERTDGYYRTSEWRKLRRACFYRDRYHCLRCDKRFKTEALNAHHLLPRAEGGADDLSNLVSLCSPCHDYVEGHNLRERANIIASYEPPAAPAKEARPVKEFREESEIDRKRPDWHKHVYGGVKRRS